MSKSYFILFFALLSITMPAQEPLFLKKTIVLNADHFWGRDTFDIKNPRKGAQTVRNNQDPSPSGTKFLGKGDRNYQTG